MFEAFICEPKGGKIAALALGGRKKDGKLRHLADSAQWRNFDRSFKEFGAEPRNIRLGLSTNGMNPFASYTAKEEEIGRASCRERV